MSWEELNPESQLAALDLGYEEFSWNNFEDPIENLSWDEIVIEADWHQALLDLGYAEQQWDCCINNYRAYDYWELDDEDEFPLIQTAAAVLGWNETSWESIDDSVYPPSENKDWNELTDLEKAAADYMCYYEDSWNDEDTLYEQQEALQDEEDAF